MIHDTDEIDNDEAGSSIDEAEIACMAGHTEARDELRRLGWSEDQVEELESAVHGYVDFARCVVDERRYRRDE